MADEEAKSTAAAPASTAAAPAAPVAPVIEEKAHGQRWNAWQWAAVICGTSVLSHVLLLLSGQFVGATRDVAISPEIGLGAYRFVSRQGPASGERIQQAAFELHIRLLSGIRQLAWEQLESRKFRVRQSVEELLRQADARDFEDPALVGLKRRVQEKINQSLEMRAVDEVIITNLALQSELQSPASGAPTESAEKPAEQVLGLAPNVVEGGAADGPTS